MLPTDWNHNDYLSALDISPALQPCTAVSSGCVFLKTNLDKNFPLREDFDYGETVCAISTNGCTAVQDSLEYKKPAA